MTRVHLYPASTKPAWTCLCFLLAIIFYNSVSIVYSLRNPLLAVHHSPSNSARLLAAEYAFNSLAADARYKDNFVIVTGEVVRVGRDEDASPYVILSRASEEEAVQEGVKCRFVNDEANRLALATLWPGNLMTLQGTCTGKEGLVQLRDCVYPLRGDLRVEGVLCVTRR